MPVIQKYTPATMPIVSINQWIPAPRFDTNMIPAALRAWLLDDGLLTRKLQQHCGNRFRFELCGESKSRIDEAQSEYLVTAPGSALLREIALRCGDMCLVYARTLIPDSTLEYHPWLSDLKTRPLGETLRERNDCMRSEFDFAQLANGNDLYEQASQHAGASFDTTQDLWARRSLFRLGDHPLLVYEVFMPAIDKCQ